MSRPLARNIPLFYVYYLFKNASFQRGIFLLFLIDKGFHDVELGTLQATLYLVNFAAEVPTGMLGDKFGRRWSILAGLTITVATGVAQLLLGGLTPFLVLFALQGVAFAFVSGSDAALFYDSLKALGREADYVKLRARMGLIGSTSLAVAMAVGGVLKAVSWTAVYLTSAAAMTVAAASVALMKEAPTTHPKDEEGAAGEETVEKVGGEKIGAEAVAASDEKEPGVLEAMRVFATDPVGRALLPLVLASGFLHAALTPYFVFAQGLFEAQSVSIATIAVVMSAIQVASGLFGLVAERVSTHVTLGRTFFLTLFALIACLLLNLLDRAFMSVALFAVAMIVPEVLVILIDNHLQEKIPSRVRASILSAFSLVEACLTGISYVIMGLMLAAFKPAAAIAALTVFPAIALVFGAVYFMRPAAATPAKIGT